MTLNARTVWSIAALLSVLGCFTVGLSLSIIEAQAPDPNRQLSQSAEPLQDLENEPSRADLFKMIVQSAKANEPQAVSAGERIFSLYGPFTFPNDTVFDVIDKRPRVDSIFGIDISHHTPSEIPLERLHLRNIKFVYMKATQGATFKDGKFQSFWSRLGSMPAGSQVHRGAYHFLTAQADPAAQARTYLRVLAANGGLSVTDMPPVVDLEWDIPHLGDPDAWAALKPDQILDGVLIWLKAVEANTKRSPIVYTNAIWWAQRIGSVPTSSRLGAYKIWIADYSPSDRGIEVPSVPNQAPWAVWQFTDASRFATEFTGSVDANIFKGTQEQFYKTFQVEKF